MHTDNGTRLMERGINSACPFSERGSATRSTFDFLQRVGEEKRKGRRVASPARTSVRAAVARPDVGRKIFEFPIPNSELAKIRVIRVSPFSHPCLSVSIRG